MARELTAGFALIAEIGEAEISRIFGRTFLAQFPKLVRTVGGATVEMWFRTPTLKLIPSDLPFQNLVEIRLPLSARSSTRFDECHGQLIVRPALVQIEVEQDGKTLIAPVIDFRGLVPAAFAVDIDNADFAPLIRTALHDALNLEEFIAGPLFPETGQPFFFKSFFRPPPQNNVLTVLIADPGNVPRLPDTLPVLLGGIHVLIPIETIQEHVNAKLAEQGLNTLPKRIDDDTVMTAFSIAYNAGHILITGALDADVGPFTSTVHFKAWLRLWAQDQTITVQVARTTQTTDVLGDILDFVSGGAVTRFLEEAVPAAIKSIGGNAFGSLGFFVSEVPFEASFAVARAFGAVLLRPDGFGIPVELTNRTSPIEEAPQYFRGHVHSREVHTPTGCPFGSRISAANLRRFPSAEQAIVMGYDGCKTCMPQYNIAGYGVLEIWVHGPERTDKDPEVEAVLAPGLSRFGIPLGPIRETGLRPFWQVDGAGTKARYTLDKIVPGDWTLSVKWGNWSTSGPLTVARRWLDADGNQQGLITVVHAERGSPGFATSTRS